MNAWAMLGVNEAATVEQIRAAHRREILRYHPDHAPAGMRGQYEDRAKRINAARDELLHHRRRHTAAPRPAASPPRPQQRAPTTSASPPSYSAAAPHASQVPAPGPTARTVTPGVSAKPVGRDPVSSGFGFVFWAVAIYFGLLAFAVLGWLVTALPVILAPLM